MDFYHKSGWVVYFMRKRGKFLSFTWYNFPRSSTNCMNYIDLGERSISRKNTILLPLFLLLPLVVVAWPFINFVSVQLSMITGKASIIILVVSHSLIYSSATKSESAQQQQAMLFTFCAWLLAKCWHGGSSSSEEGEGKALVSHGLS